MLFEYMVFMKTFWNTAAYYIVHDMNAHGFKYILVSIDITKREEKKMIWATKNSSKY